MDFTEQEALQVGLAGARAFFRELSSLVYDGEYEDLSEIPLEDLAIWLKAVGAGVVSYQTAMVEVLQAKQLMALGEPIETRELDITANPLLWMGKN